MLEQKVVTKCVQQELKDNKEAWIEGLVKEHADACNDNWILRKMVHMFHDLEPTRCPGCKAGPSKGAVCKACVEIMQTAEFHETPGVPTGALWCASRLGRLSGGSVV